MQGLIFLLVEAGVVYALTSRNIDQQDDKGKLRGNWIVLACMNFSYFFLMGAQCKLNLSRNG